MSQVQPTIRRTDFSCPHCQAHAAQTWLRLYAREMDGESRVPFFPRGMVEDVDFVEELPAETLQEARAAVKRILAREIFLEKPYEGMTGAKQVNSVHMSRCFNCNRISLWLGDKLLDPAPKASAVPNHDIDPNILVDIEEARSILSSSPRGAAALLRLALQKLCVQLGEKGKNIDTDIKSLVAKGLDPHLQRAFDIVRVIGNEAVHPGVIDLRDDVETATELINLINIVAQMMITNRKTINALYERLPQEKLAGIEARDKKA